MQLVAASQVEADEREVISSEEEEMEAKAAEWRRQVKTAEEERRRRAGRGRREEEEREREREEEEEDERDMPPLPFGPSGREEMFVLRESKRVFSTEAGEMRVVRGFGRGMVIERPLHIGFITMEPRSLFVPQYLDSSLIIFVRRGEAKIGLIYEDALGERPLKMGDVYRIPAGSTFYIVNTGETQRLQIICSIDASEGLGFGQGPFQSFFIGGGIHPVSVLAGFDPQTLSTAFNVSIGELQEAMTKQRAGPIVFADTTNETDTPILWANFLKLKEEERLEHLKMVAANGEEVDQKEEEEETKWTWRDMLNPILGPENKRKEEKGDTKRAGSTPDSCNLFDRKHSFDNDYGWSIALDKHDYHPLKKSGIGLYYVNLTAGAMMAPHINPTATEYGIVLSGVGTIQVVFPNGTSGMNTEVKEGDVFWIPRYFPFCQIASRSGPFEFFGFTTSAHRNRPQFLVGATSILKGMRGPEMATAFGLTEDRYYDLVDAQRESIILPSPGAAPTGVDVETKMKTQTKEDRKADMIENVPKFCRRWSVVVGMGKPREEGGGGRCVVGDEGGERGGPYYCVANLVLGVLRDRSSDARVRLSLVLEFTSEQELFPGGIFFRVWEGDLVCEYRRCVWNLEKLQYFRIKELKDVLTQLGLSKQGKKQDLVDRILAVLVDDQVAKIMARRPTFSKEDVAKLVDDTYRKLQGCGATDLASKAQGTSDTSHTTTLKPKEEVDDTFNLDMKVRCPCGNSLLTESMIRCEDPRCQVWQHISCVIIPDKPSEGLPPVPSQFYCEVCRLSRADPFLSIVAHPLQPVKLITTSLPTEGTANPVQAADKSFHLTRSDRESLSKPEFSVQAWCMLLNDKVPFRMQWPQYADLQVNGVPVRAVSRPGSQLLGANGRDDGPNISQFTRDGINKISLTGCDARIFCFGVRFVKRRPLQQILSMIPKESDGESFEDALARVVRCIGGGGAAENADSDSDVEVVADSFTINIRCPMSGSRMKIAGRFRPCVHMGCFDLETFMQSCAEDTTEIEIKPDGSWRVKGDCERRDLTQWHLPDGSLCLPDEGESKHIAEASKTVKQEGGSLKLGIRKNSYGVWEVSKHKDGNNLSSGEKLPENNGGLEVIPTSSSGTGSGRDADDPSVNQDGNYNFGLAANNGVELESMSLNLESSHGFVAQNTPAVAMGAEVIVLSDSDEENDKVVHGADHSNGLFDNGYNYDVGAHGISGSYQVEPGLGVGGSSCLDLFNSADDEFGLPMWQLPSNTHAASTFQLFGSDIEGLDTLANTNLNSANCPTLLNDYMLAPGNALNSGDLLPGTSVGVGHSNNDLNDGLVDNPLAFGGEDPSLQIFLPTRPSDVSGNIEARNQQDVANGLRNDDWISLKLGDGFGATYGDTGAMKSMNFGLQQHHTDGTMGSLAETGDEQFILAQEEYFDFFQTCAAAVVVLQKLILLKRQVFSVYLDSRVPNLQGRNRTVLRTSAILPETVASVAVAAVAVGAAATLLIKRTKDSEKSEIPVKQCEACGGTGICSECKGEGFVLQKLSQERADRARMSSTDAATRFTSG
ncbi:hypothetical protein KSS87_017277 [Heliosperma pusillum]|nr:hypothetical protein KSS87_017277 [Heliosperma pusillum]